MKIERSRLQQIADFEISRTDVREASAIVPKGLSAEHYEGMVLISQALAALTNSMQAQAIAVIAARRALNAFPSYIEPEELEDDDVIEE